VKRCCYGLIVLLALLVPGVTARSAAAANPIATENARAGDYTWQSALTADNNHLHPAIEGYAGATSVRPGETIDFHVSMDQPGRYRIELVRLGWYGGVGGRRIACLTGSALDPTCTDDESGVSQPPPGPPAPGTRLLNANWTVTDQLRVPTDWVSGYYLAMFVATAGSAAGQTGFTPFVVQAPVGDRSPILVIVPTNTWEAYNPWGGPSLYPKPEAVKVSFNRPYTYRDLFEWEYPLLRFLERSGYDLSYATDDDVDRDPGILLAHRLVIAAGHGEYWTLGERRALEAARSRGVNLAFMGANDGYWQIRYEDADRTIVAYKYWPDPERRPALKTIRFRDLRPPQPECELMGEQYRTDFTSSEDGRYFNYRVTAAGARDPWLRGTGLRRGSSLPGIVALEFDSVVPSCHVPAPRVLLHIRKGPFAADATRYRACSGSEVFDAGSLMFSWGLDSFRDPFYSPPDWPIPPGPIPALQRMMSNAIADMQVAHPRFDPASAVSVERGGAVVRIDPDVQANFTVSAYRIALGGEGATTTRRILTFGARRSFAWHVALSRSTAAVRLDLAVRTGDVIDTARYLLVPNGRGGIMPGVGRLDAVSCHGSSARVLTPVFGGGEQPLRVAVRIPGRFRVAVVTNGTTVASADATSRSPRGAVVSIPASEIPPGLAAVRIFGRGRRFILSTVRVEDSDDYRTPTAASGSSTRGRLGVGKRRPCRRCGRKASRSDQFVHALHVGGERPIREHLRHDIR
jgi:hypothetical protein